MSVDYQFLVFPEKIVFCLNWKSRRTVVAASAIAATRITSAKTFLIIQVDTNPIPSREAKFLTLILKLTMRHATAV